ncbi:hypothetical protein [Corynebacterium sp. 335C]
MSISRHLDAWLAERGIRPDDAIVSEDPCAVFDGRVLDSEGRETSAPAPAGGGAPCEDGGAGEGAAGAGGAGYAESRDDGSRDDEAAPDVEDAAGLVRRLLDGE